MKPHDFNNYRAFIRHKIKENGRLRGYQKQLADVAGCQSSFLSQVLNSHVQLTPDHGAALAGFWTLEDAEAEYFVGLINRERASSPQLRRMIDNRLGELKAGNEDLGMRFSKGHTLTLEHELKYYSRWYMAAVHMCITIRSCRTAKQIAEKLRMPQNVVQSALTALEEINLAEQTTSGWVPTETNIHLPRRSSLNITNHIVWRHLVLNRIQENDPDDIHYTAVHTLSHRDFDKFKKTVFELIETLRAIVDPSPEEEVVCFTLDCFKF